MNKTLFLKVLLLFVRESLYLAYSHSDFSVFEPLAPSTGRISNSSTSSGAVAPANSAAGQPQPGDQDTFVQRAEHIPAGKRTPMCAHCNQVIRLVVLGISREYLIRTLIFIYILFSERFTILLEKILLSHFYVNVIIEVGKYEYIC